MISSCLICLESVRDTEYHSACLHALFGTKECPVVDLGSLSVEEAVSRQSQRISISGVQQKLLVDLSPDKASLIPNNHGRYILKPPTVGYLHLPENEHLTMRLAGLVRLPVPPNGLVRISKEDLAYVVKRFDRTDEMPPRKLRQEDFCSLSRRDPNDKYESSAEECAEIVRRFCDNDEESLSRLFLQFAFSYWTSNSDLHLKNLSLLESSSGAYKLSPAYDLLSTRLYPQLRQGTEAVSLNGKHEQWTRLDFLALGQKCGIATNQVEFRLDQMLDHQDEAKGLISRSLLSANEQKEYLKWMKQKARLLSTVKRSKAS
jgi:serine/threonine-protein kinase HipA